MGKLVRLVVVMLFLAVCRAAPAGTWYVDLAVSSSGEGTSWETAFQTVQEGIDAAGEGDTVIVAEGTYVENIHFEGKNIVLRSKDPCDPDVVQATIIDANEAGRVVVFSGTEGESCILAGFTIRGGQAEGAGGGVRGGGSIIHTHATICNNVIMNNRAFYGGGVAFCDGIIEGNTLKGNLATEYWVENDPYEPYWSPGKGGGLYACQGPIRNNTITENYASLGAGLHSCGGTITENRVVDNEGGAGVGLCDCDGLICGNEIHGNFAWSALTLAGGAGLRDCDGTIRDNIISYNSAGDMDQSGGGLGNCDGIIENNLIVGNRATRDGGGLASCDGLVQNNTIVRNQAGGYGSGLDECKGTIRNCIIWGNQPEVAGGQVTDCSTATYSCIQNWAGGGEGNIPFSPYFVNPDGGDFHLRPWSPCIDAGDPTSAFSTEPEPNGGRVNMGAYGNTVEAASRCPDSDGDGLPDEWEMLWFDDLGQAGEGDFDDDRIPDLLEYRYGWDPKVKVETRVRNATRATWHASIQSAIVEAEEGDEIVVEPGVYEGRIGFGGKNVILRSVDPGDPAVVASTVLDGGWSERTVLFSGDEDESCVLTGFTIRKAREELPVPSAGILGGTYEARTHATIRGNVIAGNETDGLMFCDGVIERNQIIGNRESGLAYCDGTIRSNVIADNGSRGLCWCHGAIEDNLIARNQGGLCYCDGVIERNVIADNASYSGGGLYECHGTIRNNLVVGNRAQKEGGGLHKCQGEIGNNTIVENVASKGGGLEYCWTTIANCIVWGNQAGTGPQIWASRTPTYSFIQGWTEGGEGNRNLDPRFVDADGADDDPETWEDNDYRLSGDTPCIDAGMNEEWMWTAVDLGGKPRIWNGAGAWTVDVGAHEYTPFRRWSPAISNGVDGGIELIWDSRPMDSYTIWSCVDLSSGLWIEEETLSWQGVTTTWSDGGVASGVKFYKVEITR